MASIQPAATASSPFDDVRRLLASIPPAGAQASAAAGDTRAAPSRSLGRLDAIVDWLALWQGKRPPTLARPLVCVFAASHGVADAAVTNDARRRLDTFSAGEAAINRICAVHGLGFKVFDLALDLPTADITRGEAMDEKSCVATMAFGMESIAGGADLLALGDLGTGSDLAAGAIFAALFGGDGGDWAPSAASAQAPIAAALAHHAGHLADPLDILRRLGGRDIAAMAGAILAARLQRIPIVLDGLGSCAAAAVLRALEPSAIDHCLAGHRGADPVHGRVLARLGLEPVLDLGIAIGEGTGAALAAGILKAAVACRRPD